MNFDFVTQAAKRMIKHGDIDLVKDDITVHLIYEPYKHDARIAFIADETVKSLSDINHHLPTWKHTLQHDMKTSSRMASG